MTIVKSWPKGTGEEIRVSLDTYKGKPIISVRTWYTDDEAGEKRPGKNGINLPVTHLKKLSRALRCAVKKAEASGVLEKEDADEA